MKCGNCSFEVKPHLKYCRNCGSSIHGAYVSFIKGRIIDDLNIEREWKGGGAYMLKLDMIADEKGIPHFRFAYLIKPEGKREWTWASKREPIIDNGLLKDLIARALREKEWFRKIVFAALDEAGL